MDAFDSSDQSIAIVTGAASGIGLSVALRLAREGYRVVVVDRDAPGGRQAVVRIAEEGGNATFIECDVAIEEDVEALSAFTARASGQVSVLVNCAGIVGDYTPVEDLTVKQWRRMVDVTLTGAFLCTRAVLPSMLAARVGCVVNVGSVGAIVPERLAAHYCAAKAGLAMFTRSLALELASQGIQVNSVHPGAIASAAPREPSAAETPTSRIPVGRLGEVDEVASMVAYLASDEGKYVHGADVVVDGGYLLGR
jgi:NAD(P)-dependent dehydrogenase (short-subunit alcohol dehydrogenase family)